MATKLRKCLYIGLGGTGMNALLRTKKMFIDNYGEVPPMIGFLGIDTDSGVYSKTLPTKNGEVSLLPSEQCSITVDNPKAYYTRLKKAGKLTWLPDENASAIDNLKVGAGQIRTNGRLAFVYNVQKLSDKVDSALSTISNATIIENAKYAMLDGDAEVHMVFSICGGTGCGTFIDTAYLVQNLSHGTKVVGYAVLPNVFNEMARGVAMQFTRPNALGAIKDLDYLMSLTNASPEFELDWETKSYKTNSRPFSAINLIDNRNDAGSTYQHVDELTDMISLALVSVAGEIGTQGASVADNVEKSISAGIGNIEDKIAWFSSLGTSEIVFRGSDVAKVYALKSAMKLVNNLGNTTDDGTTEATNWIDDPDVNIRENNGKDNVIDKIIEGIRPQHTPVITPASAAADAGVFLQSYLPADAKFANAVDAMKKNVASRLQTKVESLIQRAAGGGLKLAEEMLESIKYNIDELFKSEMIKEQDELEQRVPVLKQYLDTACIDLTEYAAKFFKSKNEVNNKIDEVVSAAIACGENALEIKRRIYAIQFYNAISSEVTVHLDRVKNLSELFKSVRKEIGQEISAAQNLAADSSAVRIDLSSAIVKSIEVEEELLLSEFVSSLGANSIYYLSTKEAIANALRAYCDNLPEVNRWNNRTIDNVLDELPEEELVQQTKIAMHKAKPMMKIDDNGYSFTDATVYKGYFVCVPDKTINSLTKDNPSDGMSLFEKNSHSNNISYVSTGLNDRVIIYRQECTYPAFIIESLESCKRPYEEMKPIRFHFDATVYNMMVRNKFKLEPTANTVIADTSLALWVKALIFGLVKFETGKYWYIDRENGKATKKYWMSTEQRDRDLAYKVFTEKAMDLQEKYDEFFEKESSKMGNDNFNTLIDDVQENYLDKFSQLNITMETLESKGYESICNLVEQELKFVENKLSKR